MGQQIEMFEGGTFVRQGPQLPPGTTIFATKEGTTHYVFQTAGINAASGRNGMCETEQERQAKEWNKLVKLKSQQNGLQKKKIQKA